MTKNESKYGKVVIVGGGRNAGRTMQAQVELLARIDELEAYRAIGTVEEFKALKEKKKMKPLKAYDEERESNWCSCPNCAKGIGWEYEKHFNFCNECGTEFDWSE